MFPSSDGEAALFFYLGLILLSGCLAGDLAHLLKLPRISGYIAAGFLLGPSVSGIISTGFLEQAHPLIDASLSLITFLIGGTLRWSRLSVLGRAILSMALAEATCAALLTSLGMTLVLHLFWSYPWLEAGTFGALFAALAAPTDPSAILAVVHEHHRARGRFVTVLLGVTALDDALAVLFYALATAVALALTGREHLEVLVLAEKLLWELGGAALLGLLAGMLLAVLGKWADELKVVVTATLGLLLLTYAVAAALQVEPLLATMIMGVVLTNLHVPAHRFFRPFENLIEDLFFTGFFVLSGALLQLSSLGSFVLLVALFVFLRLSGKVFGVELAGRLNHLPPSFRRALGLSLMPQGGIVIGLALLASQKLGITGENWLVGVVITATFLHEVVGPVVVGYELRRWTQHA